MLNPNQAYGLPSILKWYQITLMLLWDIIISIFFAFYGHFFAAFIFLFIFFFLPIWLIVVALDSSTSFSFDDNKITINRGRIAKTSNNIPFPNVQNVQTNSGLLMSLFGISGIKIWTASQGQIGSSRNSKPDGYLRLITEDAKQLEEIILQKK